MPKSANEVMQEVVLNAVLDGMIALKSAARGLPNILVRDLAAIHQNTTFADLPEALQASINASVRAAFTRLLKEGYAVSPAGSRPPPSPASRAPGGPPDARRRPPKTGGAGDRRDRPRRPGAPRGRPKGK